MRGSRTTGRRVRVAAAGPCPPLAPRALAATLAVILVLALLWWLSSPRGSAPGSPPYEQVRALLERVEVVEQRVRVPGYERDCTGSSACVFGPAWSDATGAPGGGNGCPTRSDVLARDLVGARRGPGPECTVRGGVLVDPYTGRTVDLARVGASGVHVDHVYPLAAAWDLGAWGWPLARRAAFANDVDRNLLAVIGRVNTEKGDATPGEWMPPDTTRHCFYAARYLGVAVTYRLPVTRADRDALDGAVRRCPAGP